uniref:ATP-dependent Clp protease proteolytic subunit n=1 Tax=Astragalus sieversianus TaxID=158325 RepID=UPI0027A76D9B|nr:ATP-dependent Clp protease proteolytic subunit [Astragalus sieversianus]WFG51700.1 ATP-dependent Clp protease proteolytic subunit [Astragalus sieversianus]
MPVGIPKVPFFFPEDDEDEDASWIDLYNRSYEERLLFLGQEINSEISNQIVGLMVYLSIADKTRDIYLFINSPGGGVISGMSIYDGMHFVEADVQTVCVGVAASMAALILVGGVITQRLAFPHAWRIMIHQPASSYLDGQSVECMMEIYEIQKMSENIINTYAQRTGKPAWQIEKDMKRDSFMSAEEAQAYGLVDMVAESVF